MSEITTRIIDRNKSVDEFEHLLLSNFEAQDAPIRSFFANGMYAREMTVKAGQWVTSKIHKTEFFFVVPYGKMLVAMDEGVEVEITGYYFGISKPYSRRVAYVVEDSVWITFHANPDNEDEFQIEERIIEKHENLLITDEMKEKITLVKHEQETIKLIH